MPRRIQDIVPKGHRSIRDIPDRAVKKKSSELSKNKKDLIDEDRDFSFLDKDKENEPIQPKDEGEININRISTLSRRMPVTPPVIDFKPKKKIGKWTIITLLVVGAIVVSGYFASTYYAQATFTIVPKTIPVTVNSTYVAQGNAQNSGLFYDVITVKSSATTTVPATNGPVTNTKATGKVTFYNNYSSQSVRLIAGTRLSRDDGLVYRLSSSIVIPGYTKTGTTINPGKISAAIAADQPGQNYNLTLNGSNIDLKIVAYKGSAKYNSIYARLTTNITGGFSGVKKNVSQSTLASSTTALKIQLTSKLLEEANIQVPNGFILYKKAYTTSFSEPMIGNADSSLATINIQGTLYAIVLPKNKFIESLAGSQTISLFGPFSYTAPGLEELDVNINNIKDFSPTKKNSLVIHAKGDIKVVGLVPVDEIKDKLKGLKLSDTEEVFKAYDAVIKSGSGELAPPWATIPNNPDRLKIIVQDE